MRRYPPSPALRPWVAAFEIFDSPASSGPVSILPDVGPVLGFQFRGRVLTRMGQEETLLDPCGITGLQSGARSFRYLPGSGTVLVRFHPWGAAAFLPVPMHELAGRSVGLAAVLETTGTRATLETLDRALEAPDDAARLRAVEALLLALLRERRPDGVLRRAVGLLHRGEAQSVGRLARDLGVGERQLERKFREWVGVGPKRFAGLVRFRRALDAMQADPGRAAAGLAAGWFDQAHFIKDFRAFAGTTPEAYLASLRRPA